MSETNRCVRAPVPYTHYQCFVCVSFVYAFNGVLFQQSTFFDSSVGIPFDRSTSIGLYFLLNSFAALANFENGT